VTVHILKRWSKEKIATKNLESECGTKILDSLDRFKAFTKIRLSHSDVLEIRVSHIDGEEIARFHIDKAMGMMFLKDSDDVVSCFKMGEVDVKLCSETFSQIILKALGRKFS
jgi:hypothetical protein